MTSATREVGEATGVIWMPEGDGATDNRINRYAMLIAEGEQEYKNALTPEEIETVLQSMRSLDVYRSSPDAAAHRFARRLPALTTKLQGLSSLALAALADESERRQRIPEQL